MDLREPSIVGCFPELVFSEIIYTFLFPTWAYDPHFNNNNNYYYFILFLLLLFIMSKSKAFNGETYSYKEHAKRIILQPYMLSRDL